MLIPYFRLFKNLDPFSFQHQILYLANKLGNPLDPIPKEARLSSPEKLFPLPKLSAQKPLIPLQIEMGSQGIKPSYLLIYNSSFHVLRVHLGIMDHILNGMSHSCKNILREPSFKMFPTVESQPLGWHPLLTEEGLLLRSNCNVEFMGNKHQLAYVKLLQTCDQNKWILFLHPGNLLIINNYRVLHEPMEKKSKELYRLYVY